MGKIFERLSSILYWKKVTRKKYSLLFRKSKRVSSQASAFSIPQTISTCSRHALLNQHALNMSSCPTQHAFLNLLKN